MVVSFWYIGINVYLCSKFNNPTKNTKIMNKELEILKLQNRIVLLQGRTEKDNKNVQRKCLRKLKKIQE